VKATFKYLKTNLIYPDCEEVKDTYIITVTRDKSKTKTQALFDYLIKELEFLGKELSKGTEE